MINRLATARLLVGSLKDKDSGHHVWETQGSRYPGVPAADKKIKMLHAGSKVADVSREELQELKTDLEEQNGALASHPSTRNPKSSPRNLEPQTANPHSSMSEAVRSVGWPAAQRRSCVRANSLSAPSPSLCCPCLRLCVRESECESVRV